MNERELSQLLADVADGKLDVKSACQVLQRGPFRSDALEFATPDYHRALRCGLAEVIFGEGKSSDQITEIAIRLGAEGEPVLVTRLSDRVRADLERHFPSARSNRPARTLLLNPPPEREAHEDEPYVVIAAAGTADLPVAEEAAEVCVASDVPFRRLYDVGVAGLHRILNRAPELQSASAVVVVAGMEGALPSVVGSLVRCPVFAVPTSVGYGASFGGLAALLAMLNSCVPGITVTNIDNGFSAAVAAVRVVRAMTPSVRPGPERR